MSEYKQKIYTPHNKLTAIEKAGVAKFLHKHLGEYGDDLNDINHCLDYAMKEVSALGGFVITRQHDEEIVGAVVINRTGMSGYIPENILVYIAVHADYRGHGLGKQLMQDAIDHSRGDIALHVEPDNPAKFLYDKMGFEKKYVEMRYSDSEN